MWDELQEDPRYFESFKKSKLYIKLLAELDLLQDATIAKPSDTAAVVYENGCAPFHIITLILLDIYHHWRRGLKKLDAESCSISTDSCKCRTEICVLKIFNLPLNFPKMEISPSINFFGRKFSTRL